MNRRGFTLLELIVSIAVAGVIALLVYASASAGFDTRDALDRYRAGSEAEMRARLLLSDALRHATDEVDGADVFRLVDGADARGTPTDHLTFRTRGVAPPLGASGQWTVTLATTQTGLLIRAVPVAEGGAAPPGVSAVLADIRGIDVAVASLADPSWAPTWQSPAQLPSAVRITLFDRAGAPVGAPLVTRVGLEALR